MKLLVFKNSAFFDNFQIKFLLLCEIFHYMWNHNPVLSTNNIDFWWADHVLHIIAGADYSYNLHRKKNSAIAI